MIAKDKPKKKLRLTEELRAVECELKVNDLEEVAVIEVIEPDDDPSTEAERKGYYFDNHKVEQLLIVYVNDGCIDVKKRDEIMSHASELIRQIIRTHNFHNIYPGADDASFNDLFQVAWVQIESTLYKFDSSQGHTKVFNMWSQVAKTVMLAHIKKEMRDKKNYKSYKKHLDTKSLQRSVILRRFVDEAREVCKHNREYLDILGSLGKLYDVDQKPHEGLIGKLVKASGKSRSKISSFLRTIRLRSFEFTDAPISEEKDIKEEDGRITKSHVTFEEDEYDAR
jgi:hypothetical protein